MALSLKDDRFFAYSGHPILIDVLANDSAVTDYSFPSSSDQSNLQQNLSAEFSSASNIDDVNTEHGSTSDPIQGATTSNAMTGLAATGPIYITNFGTFSEDDGILQIDLENLIDPSTATSPTISDITITDLSISQFFSISSTISNNVLSIDLDQLGTLNSGESLEVRVRFTASNGVDSNTNTILFNVTGADDVTSTITTPNGGILTGDGNDNILVSRLNTPDLMLGGNGADVFKFGSDYLDGNEDSDTILDFQVGRDTLEFESGSAIRFMFEIDNGVMITLDDGWDSVIVFGDYASLSNVDATGLTPQSASGGGSTGSGSFTQSLQDYSDNFNWAIGLPSSSGVDLFPSPNPFIFDPF